MEATEFKQKVKKLGFPIEQADEHIEYCELKKGAVKLEDFFAYPTTRITEYYLDEDGHLKERWNYFANVPYNISIERLLANR